MESMENPQRSGSHQYAVFMDSQIKTMTLVVFSLIAFSANSLFCRMALGSGTTTTTWTIPRSRGTIDPAYFTSIRLSSGALALLFISRLLRKPGVQKHAGGSWKSGLALFLYAGAFSLAYVTLSAGTGALILFRAVQLTMLGWAMLGGERMGWIRWLGILLSMGGLVYLVLPGLEAPDPTGALLMTVSGIAWGIYSIRGKGAPDPTAMTTGNFCRAATPALIGTLIFHASINLQPMGILLAISSGAVASALGYVIWYTALRRITTAQASIVQLLIPQATAFGGVMFLSEPVSMRLIAASILILAGVAIALHRS